MVKKGSNPEMVEVSPDDVGQVSEIIAPVEAAAAAPQEVVEEKIEMGKVPEDLRKRFLSVYQALKPLATKIVHSPGSKRHHFKPVSVVLFYSKNPVADIAVHVEGQKKHARVRYKITDKGLIGPDGKSITLKELVAKIREFKKAKGL